ncbi:hypothetical protein PG984_010564 [Apiospora sp. TS-2023a]
MGLSLYPLERLLPISVDLSMTHFGQASAGWVPGTLEPSRLAADLEGVVSLDTFLHPRPGPGW